MVESEVCPSDADVEAHAGADLDFNTVMTQGRHLTSHTRTTPTCTKSFDFTALDEKLNRLINVAQEVRIRMYGREVAEEWPISHTPPEVKQEYLARSNARWAALEEADTSGDESDFDRSTLDLPKARSARPMTPIQSDLDTSLSSLSDPNSPSREATHTWEQTGHGTKRCLEGVHVTGTKGSKRTRVVSFSGKRRTGRDTDARCLTGAQDAENTSWPADPSPPP